jgi:DnaJ-class molecular chaperone
MRAKKHHVPTRRDCTRRLRLAVRAARGSIAKLENAAPDFYATLGLDRRCTTAQIRAAYRALTKRHHPDLHPGSSEAAERMQLLNAAHETLIDPARRRAHDRDLDAQEAPARTRERETRKIGRNIAHDARLRLEDFIRGATIEVRVTDPANPNGMEIFRLEIPPDTAPGARFRIPRTEPFEGGTVTVRVKAAPGFRFKASGSDLRCDLRISTQRAMQGGTEMVQSVTGTMLRVQIPRGVGRGAVLRIAGEGLPKPRGGRGDLLVRITYRPEVRSTRLARR